MKYHSIVVLIVAVLLLSCQGANDCLYDQLDAHLLRKEEVLKRKDQQLDSLKHLLDRCHDVEGRYAIHEQLYQQYLLFHADSAMNIKDEQHAQKLGTMTEKTNGQLQ